MRKLFIFILGLSILSVFFIAPPLFSNEIFIHVENNSRSDIKNIKIYVSSTIEESKRRTLDVSDTLYYIRLKPNDSFKYVQNMKNISGDGCYVIEFQRENKEVEVVKHGYYSNGSPLDKGIRYSIESDSIAASVKHLLFYNRVFIK